MSEPRTSEQWAERFVRRGAANREPTIAVSSSQELSRASTDEAGQAGGEGVRTSVRGSTLLLLGRVLSVAINLVVQVLIVRYLSQSDYGAFAYAVSLVSAGALVVTLGLDRSLPRFAAIYDENGEHDKLLGLLALQLGAIIGLGLLATVVVLGFQSWLTDAVLHDPQVTSLLVLLIALAPAQALDTVVLGLFAVFARPAAIFLRRYLLTPGLRLVVVAAVILTDQDVTTLAVGYVITGAAGAVVYSLLVWRLLKDRWLVRPRDRRSVSIPFKEVFSFTLPLLSTELLYLSMHTVDAVLLARYAGTAEVGALRAIEPAARTNQLVMLSFGWLFTPLASRLLARGDRKGIAELYWSTTVWVAVVSFPLLALTMSLAEPLTVTLFGDRYSSSAVYLAILAVAYYQNAALGLNGLVLKVSGQLRYVVTINLAAGVLNLGLNLVLIPRYGALGAALGTGATLVVHNLLRQAGLGRVGAAVFERRYAPVYATIVACAASLWACQQLLDLGIVVGGVLAGGASLVVLLVGRHELALGHTFPELGKLPVLGRLVRNP